MSKKLGFRKIAGQNIDFISNRHSIHIAVLFGVLATVIFNFNSRNRSGVFSESTHKAIVASLVKNEFGETTVAEEELIEEHASNNLAIQPKQHYINDLAVLMDNQSSLPIGEETEEGALQDLGNEVIRDERQGAIAKRDSIIDYTVAAGDSVSTIASKFGISVNTILWENDLSPYSLIRPGDILKILPTTGISYKVKSGDSLTQIAKKYGVEEDEIIKYNQKLSSGRLLANQEIVIPGAIRQPGSSLAGGRANSEERNSYSGLSAIKKLVAPPDAKPVASNKMNWPASGHRITQYYSWRHTGLDIANKVGTPLYAADTGIVEYAGWSKGYGYNVVVDHGGGKKTRYAHASALYVKKGVYVAKGQTIAGMGSTGWSTGPHIHFEVIINGVKYNPLNYIR